MNRIAIALVLILASALHAKTPMNVQRIKIAGRDVTNYTIDPGQTKTSDPIPIGDTQIQAWMWDQHPASGTASLNVIILQANSPDGPFSEWSSPADGSSPTTDITVTANQGGSPWKWTPSQYVEYRFRNSAAVPNSVTADHIGQ